MQKSEGTDKLVLMLGINDLDKASLITGREPKFYEAVKMSSELGASLFPLLTRKHVMVNAGLMIDVLFKAVSIFMPQRVLDKVAFMSCSDLVSMSGIPPRNFPDFLGGTCKVAPDSPLSRLLS
mmetsp:Transcript_115905/g.259116  ORF Transcript_115905/g.259116 Transcript_115905/m.259116 type:complete len:123 (-) Transcript_115905:179-547(-)